MDGQRQGQDGQVGQEGQVGQVHPGAGGHYWQAVVVSRQAVVVARQTCQ